jgi:ribosomal RNA-processing protein 1
MWMSDKPLVQEELSEELGSLVHCFPDIKISIQFFQQFLETMCLEWFGIDQWRIDKFMMVSGHDLLYINHNDDDMTLNASILKII